MTTVLEVRSPLNNELMGKIPRTPRDEIPGIVRKAQEDQGLWGAVPIHVRAKFLLRLRETVYRHRDELVELIHKETGKPRVEAMAMEVVPVLDLIGYFAKRGPRFLKSRKIPLHLFKNKRSSLLFKPVGVIGIISPWNFPFSIPMGEIAMALLCGNSVILKPSEFTSLVGQKIAELIAETQFPKGIFQTVIGTGEEGETLLRSGLNKVFFTGSVRTGKRVMEICSEKLTPVVLELGGKDPMIVCADADLDLAAAGAVWGSFCNAGQACASVERIYVVKEVAQEFITKVCERASQLRVGVDRQHDTDVGAITMEKQLQTYRRHLDDALKKGAKIELGGKEIVTHGRFFGPTVLTNVNHNMEIMTEETFGPFCPIMVVEDEERALYWANKSQYGLCGSVWSRDIKKARALAERLQVGTVTINDCVYTHALPETPWGGVKESGVGRVHSIFGLLECVQIHHINEDRGWFPPFWWYPYTKTSYDLLDALATFLAHRNPLKRVLSGMQIIKLFFKKRSENRTK